MRSLILAGGGLKVAYQAGCLQVLLDELGLRFDHVDGASGGCFNAAMMANGMTGTQIADAWRNINPVEFTTLNFIEYWKGPYLRSIGTSEGTRNAFKTWNLDFNAIRKNRSCVFTFNYFHFTEKRVISIENKDLDEDVLVACVALPVWFSPVKREQSWLFDAVYCTDGNVGEAVRRGADEIWAIWTVSDLPEYRDGLMAQYFHIIETVANAKFKDEWNEIAAVNFAIAQHGPDNSRPTTDLRLREGFASIVPALRPPAGRKKIIQHLIKQEVPVQYVAIVSKDRMAAAVEMGVRDTREYAQANALPATRASVRATSRRPISLQFSETMRGFFMPGESDPEAGERRGRAAGNRLTVHLGIRTNDLGEFLRSPDHQCAAEGTVTAPLLSGNPMFATGSFNLFVNERNATCVPPMVVPAHKEMRYDLSFTAQNGTPYRLRGRKIINDGNGFTPWPATTTLYCMLFQEQHGQPPKLYGAGIIHVMLLDFLQELTTFKVLGVSEPREAKAQLLRFGAFWLGQLWDVYGRALLDYGPF